ncbi:cyclic lactone autoinducer peptide [Desulfofundulus australicus DSM 11792]|jgi:cyclic lactone autoinducer peptide|uniref:Cyclic lactone autoinducer peptide n=1 Tax=Desulfofundulus australicus DSM 11792 TaxID=1121425 RepID=A0A1M4UTD3_9FIRM|nr:MULTISPECIES: cyclic lactone autoinducer peptide [Desulfofundulus]SHE59939.1 cyclic lactone autoinducer peptide [Desulfofundulus australicus DSM 11792]
MRLKHWLLGAVATLAMVMAATGIYPASWVTWYQPEVPEELRK